MKPLVNAFQNCAVEILIPSKIQIRVVWVSEKGLLFSFVSLLFLPFLLFLEFAVFFLHRVKKEEGVDHKKTSKEDEKITIEPESTGLDEGNLEKE